MLAGNLRRGLAAGLVAGLLAGLVALVIGEPPLEQAIRLEEAVARFAAAPEPHMPTVSRATQRAGLVLALVLVGCSLGGLFGAVYAAVRSRLTATSDWAASLQVGLAGWAGLALLPSLKYPAIPPGVGDPGTVGARSGWYAAAVVLSVVTVAGAWGLNQRLLRRGLPPARRQLIAATVACAGGVLLAAALPARLPVGGLPPELVWDLRLATMSVHAALWLGMSAALGLLAEHAAPKGAP